VLTKHSLVAACLAAHCLAAQPSFGQTAHPIDEVRGNARSHIGPFYITPTLVMRDLGVDDNVFNDAEDRKSDFTFTLTPKADIAVPFARWLLLTSTVAADFVYYREYSSERSASPRVAPRATIFLNRLSFFGEGSYSRSRQRPNFEIDTRALRTERAVGGGIGYQFSPKVGVEVSGRRSDVDYDAGETFLNVSLRETLNRRSDTIAAAVKYAVTPLTTIVLKADRAEDRFEFSPERNADTLRVTPGVEFNASALISGSAYAGVRRFNARSELLEDFTGLVASATLGYTLLGRTAFIANVERDVTYSFERLQPYYVVNSYGLTLRHRFTGKFDVMAGAARHEYSYRDLAHVPAAGTGVSLVEQMGADQRVDATHSYSMSLGYYFGPDIRVGFGTTYWKRESNAVRLREYDAFRTGVSLDYGF
jgi:putative beta-barrel porin BBP2